MRICRSQMIPDHTQRSLLSSVYFKWNFRGCLSVWKLCLELVGDLCVLLAEATWRLSMRFSTKHRLCLVIQNTLRQDKQGDLPSFHPSIYKQQAVLCNCSSSITLLKTTVRPQDNKARVYFLNSRPSRWEWMWINPLGALCDPVCVWSWEIYSPA